MNDALELDPRPGEIVPMDYAEHEHSYQAFRRLLLLIIAAALIFILGWMLWL